MKKAKIIKMTPMIERKIASALPTFFVLAVDFIFFSLHLIDFQKQNPFSFQKRGTKFISRPYIHLRVKG
jgi:hypothetical protein